jgi:hypothetical protein
MEVYSREIPGFFNFPQKRNNKEVVPVYCFPEANEERKTQLLTITVKLLLDSRTGKKIMG